MQSRASYGTWPTGHVAFTCMASWICLCWKPCADRASYASAISSTDAGVPFCMALPPVKLSPFTTAHVCHGQIALQPSSIPRQCKSFKIRHTQTMKSSCCSFIRVLQPVPAVQAHMGCLTWWLQRHTAMASLTLASLSAEMATEEVLCLEAACAAADAAAFLLPFLPPAIMLLHMLQPASSWARS